MKDKLPKMSGGHACGITKVVFGFDIPWTKFRVEVVRVILADAMDDEVRKELTLLGFFDEATGEEKE